MIKHIYPSRFRSYLAALGLSALLAVPSALAQSTVTWNGAGADNNWSTDANWVGGVAPVDDDYLVFDGSTRTSNTNDSLTMITASSSSNPSLLFASGSGAFTLSGNQLSTWRITVSNGNTNIINNDLIRLNGSPSEVRVSNGALELNGVLSGGGGIQRGTFQTGTLRLLNDSNSFTGAVSLRSLGVTEFTSVANAGVNSALGAATGTNSIITLGTLANHHTLRYIGTSNSSTDRVVNLGGNSGTRTLGAEGTGSVKFLGGVTASGGDGTGKTLRLAGTSTADNEVAAIADDSDMGAVSLSKIEVGTWILSGTSTYTGTTAVSAGTLLINGDSSSATGNITVDADATLGGTGTIGGAVTISDNGILGPGTSPGTLTLNSTNLTMDGVDSQLEMEITGTGAGQFDQVVGIDTFGLNGDVTVSLTGTFADGTSWDLFDFASKSGDFDTVTLAGSYVGSLTRSGDLWANSDIGGQEWEFNQGTGVLSIIPEPTTVALMLGVVAMLLTVVARRK